MPKAKPLLSEDQLQKWCITYQRAVHPSLLCIHIPNGGSRNPIEAAKLKGMGTLAGVCDLLFILPKARVFWCEMKIIGGKVSDKQISFMSELTGRQHSYAICWTQEDFMVLCKQIEREIQGR